MVNMKQSNSAASKLLKQILIDLKINLWNYSKTYSLDEEDINYCSEVLKLKKMAESAILNKEYNKAITYYSYANKYVQREDLKFVSQIKFLQNILDYIDENKKEIITLLNYQKARAISSENSEEVVILNKYIFSLDGVSTKELLLEINELIENKKYIIAGNLIDSLKENGKIKNEKVVINYLNSKNIEYYINDSLSSLDKQLLENYIEKIRYLINCKKYQEAIKVINNSLLNINHPILYYYLGKVYFKMEDYTAASNCFLNYKSMGYSKYFKANVYLYSINRYRVKKKNNQAIDYMNENNIICAYLNMDEFNTRFNYIPYNYTNNDIEDVYDLKPNKLLKKIKMKEEDFIKRD